MLKVDNAPAIKAFREEGTRLVACEIVPEQQPKYDLQGNGFIENVVQRFQGQFRTLKHALESELNQRLPEGSVLMLWLVKHAADVLTKYNVGLDGKAAHQRWKGKCFKSMVLEFEERVQYL